ncbi:cytochrome c biogenesis protein [archaeon]|nr:cytochrome c biogenesis protein [archaeon]
MEIEDHMLGYNGYLHARDVTTQFGEPVLLLAALASAALIIASFFYLWKGEKKSFEHIKKIQRANLALLILGFLILVWFHMKINQNIELVNLMTGEALGSYYVPLWIESEKMYFWVMWIGVFVYLLNRKGPTVFAAVSNLSFGLSVLITNFYSSPFKDPLPIFHGEISIWYTLIEQGNSPGAWNYTGQLFGKMAYFYNSTYMWVHPPLLFIAYASLVITFLGSVFMLKSKEISIDKIAYDHAKFGYILLTFGFLIGYPWAVTAWGDAQWWWDPKVSGSLMMWMFYTAYLHSYLYVNRTGMRRVTAVIGIMCFLSLVFTYLLTYISAGVHAYG